VVYVFPFPKREAVPLNLGRVLSARKEILRASLSKGGKETLMVT